jgi:hypothetical protein
MGTSVQNAPDESTADASGVVGKYSGKYCCSPYATAAAPHSATVYLSYHFRNRFALGDLVCWSTNAASRFALASGDSDFGSIIERNGTRGALS